MRLLKLKADNFKCLGSFTFEPNGNNADIYGTNEIGKTTIMDAFTFLLTGKDSQNATEFSIKPIGGLKRGANVEVEGIFDLAGKPITLKKIYKEDWVKHRGSTKKVFEGHITDYFVNDVPVKLKGYTEKTKQIADPGLFRALTNPRYVNEEMKWQDRRRLLIEMCGDVSDADVIASHPEFEEVPAMLDGKSIDDYREQVAYHKKGINDRLKELPTRIDELEKSLPETVEVGGLGSRSADLDSRLKELRNKLSLVESGGAVGAKKAEIQDVQVKIRELEADAQKKADTELDRLRGVEKFCRQSCEEQEGKVRKLQREIRELKEDNVLVEAAMANLRDQWHKANNKSFEATETCPTCGQDIPEKMREEAQATFNHTKAEKLEEINGKGVAKKKEWEANREKINKLLFEQAETEKKLAEFQKDLEEAKTATKNQETENETSIYVGPEYKILTGQLHNLQSQLSDIQIGTRDETAGITSEIAELEAEQKEVNGKLALVESEKKTRIRIEQLLAEEKKLSKEFEKLEADLQLLEDFVRAKCDLLTDRINKQFRLVKWQLFEDQINGGLRDVCTATVGGVPYPDLNNAARINVGIDIIDALSKYYGVRMPLFIDNAESIVELLPTESQLIRLVVSEKDKKLRTVIHDEETKKAAA